MMGVRTWSSLAVLLLALRAVNADELVTNGGFEDGGAGEPWIPAGWHNGPGTLGCPVAFVLNRQAEVDDLFRHGTPLGTKPSPVL